MIIYYTTVVFSVLLFSCSSNRESTSSLETKDSESSTKSGYSILCNLNNEVVDEFQLEDKFTVKIEGTNYSVQLVENAPSPRYHRVVLPRVDITDSTLMVLLPILKCDLRDGDPQPSEGHLPLFKAILVDESIIDRRITAMDFNNITMKEFLDAISDSINVRYEVIHDVLYFYDDK